MLTAFNVESYKLLQPDPADPTLDVLTQISAQLNSYVLSPPFINATKSVDLPQASFQVSASSVWLNALWFSSLVFSFASALLALFVKQWINEAIVQGTSRESARLRQYRLNGLLCWRIGTIVVVVPILLQFASVLFLVGLLVLLWTLNNIVAALISTLVSLFFTFFLILTILPVFRSNCPYRSPASFAIYTAIRYVRNGIKRMVGRFCRVVYQCYLRLACGLPNMVRLRDFAYIRRADMPTWRGRDQNDIHAQLGALDRAIVTTSGKPSLGYVAR